MNHGRRSAVVEFVVADIDSYTVEIGNSAGRSMALVEASSQVDTSLDKMAWEEELGLKFVDYMGKLLVLFLF